MEMPSANTNSMGLSCDGEILPKGGGTWIGHFIPGLFFMLWGLHWMQAIFRRHIQSQSSGQIFSSKPWFSMAGLSFGLPVVSTILYGFEPFLKMLSGPIGLSVELYFDDKNGFRPLYCQNSGQFDMKYAHNYQHASMYPAFVLSGLVDFIGMRVRLPPGTQHLFLGGAFLVEGTLMLVHKKHLPLDAVLHNSLALCMLATAIGVFAELKAPHNFLVSAIRSYALTMHGLWMIVMGQMLFTGSKSWNDHYMGPAMLAPPFFAMICLIAAFCSLMLYMLMDLWHQKTLAYTTLPQSLKTVEEADALRRHSLPYSADDSALDTSDDGLEPHDSAGSETKAIKKQLSSVTNKLKGFHKHTKSTEHIV